MTRGPQAQGVQAERFQAISRVLIFLYNDDKVLLLRGALTKRVWPGLLNGLGGHVEANEDVLSAARREVFEESGLDLKPGGFVLRAVVSIQVNNADPGILNFVFVVKTDDHPVTHSGEGMLEWHRRNELEGLPLVEDLPWLIPRLFDQPEAAVLFAHYSFDKQGHLVMRLVE